MVRSRDAFRSGTEESQARIADPDARLAQTP